MNAHAPHRPFGCRACALPGRAVRRHHPGPGRRHLCSGWRRRVQNGGSQEPVVGAAGGPLSAFRRGGGGPERSAAAGGSGARCSRTAAANRCGGGRERRAPASGRIRVPRRPPSWAAAAASTYRLRHLGAPHPGLSPGGGGDTGERGRETAGLRGGCWRGGAPDIFLPPSARRRHLVRAPRRRKRRRKIRGPGGAILGPPPPVPRPLRLPPPAPPALFPEQRAAIL